MVIYRGTTPYLELKLKNIELTDIDVMWITFAQDGEIKVDKDLSDVVEIEGKPFLHLTQEDTLSFKGNADALMQSRILLNNDEADVTVEKKMYIKDILKDGVISRGTE